MTLDWTENSLAHAMQVHRVRTRCWQNHHKTFCLVWSKTSAESIRKSTQFKMTDFIDNASPAKDRHGTMAPPVSNDLYWRHLLLGAKEGLGGGFSDRLSGPKARRSTIESMNF